MSVNPCVRDSKNIMHKVLSSFAEHADIFIMYMYVHGYICVCMHRNHTSGGLRLKLIIFYCSPSYTLRQGLSIETGAHWLDWFSQPTCPGDPSSPPSNHWSYRLPLLLIQHLHGFWRSELWSWHALSTGPSSQPQAHFWLYFPTLIFHRQSLQQQLCPAPDQPSLPGSSIFLHLVSFIAAQINQPISNHGNWTICCEFKQICYWGKQAS